MVTGSFEHGRDSRIKVYSGEFFGERGQFFKLFGIGLQIGALT
jgi:hypothetical protein